MVEQIVFSGVKKERKEEAVFTYFYEIFIKEIFIQFVKFVKRKGIF